MSEKKIEPFYQFRAKETVDMLFDKRFLNENVNRQTINRLEDYLAFLFQSQCESAVTMAALSAKFRDEMRPKIVESEEIQSAEQYQ